MNRLARAARRMLGFRSPSAAVRDLMRRDSLRVHDSWTTGLAAGAAIHHQDPPVPACGPYTCAGYQDADGRTIGCDGGVQGC